jgi:DNA-binding transcriptional ArsR family regulator
MRRLAAGRADKRACGREHLNAVFAALGDPGRRSLVEAVAARGSATATELAAELPVTRQAVAKQLGALADAGLLRATRSGRERRYEVTPEPLGAALEWMVSVGAAWDERLDALRRSLAQRAGDGTLR